MKHCLIVEGGGFKTGFTTGILDTFLTHEHLPYDAFIGVSGGSISLSYFLSKQYRTCVSAIKHLAEDPEFTMLQRAFEKEGYMNIDFISKAANFSHSFDLEKALQRAKDSKIHFVVTSKTNGRPEYLIPEKDNWIDTIIASCSMPFITKGEHELNGTLYFDGGWSDPLPAKWAYEQGARKITVLRTNPGELLLDQSWTDYFGSFYFNRSSELGQAFANAHIRYNEGVEFILNPPDDLEIVQIAPEEELKSTSYSYTGNSIIEDYRHGLDKGLVYLDRIKRGV